MSLEENITSFFVVKASGSTRIIKELRCLTVKSLPPGQIAGGPGPWVDPKSSSIKNSSILVHLCSFLPFSNWNWYQIHNMNFIWFSRLKWSNYSGRSFSLSLSGLNSIFPVRPFLMILTAHFHFYFTLKEQSQFKFLE